MAATDDVLKPVTGRMRVWEWGVLLAILVVASFLRFQQPGTVEYRKDEANLSRLALSMARGESVPLLGIGSSIGAPNPPFSVWVFVPPYLVGGNDPILATQWVGLLNVLAVLLLFLFARRWFGLATAVVAATLFATNPWAVIWSRKIWAQDVIPFFVLLTFGTGVLGFLERRRWAQACFLPLLSITGQIYYATFVLIPAALYLIWAGRKHLGRPFWIGVGVTVLSVVPFAVGAIQAWQALPPGVAAEHLAKESEARHVALSAEVLLRLRDAWGGSGAKGFVGGEVSDLVLDGAPDGEVVYEVVGWLALLACAWLVVRALRKSATPVDRVLALWFVVTLLVYAFTWTTIWIHYMIPALPVGFLALGMLAGRVGARAALAVGAVLLVALSGLHVWSQTSTLRFVGTYDTPGGFGVPLGMRLKVRVDVLSRAPERVIVYGEGDDVHEDGEAAVWDVLLSGDKDVSVFPWQLIVGPAEDAVVVNGMLGPEEETAEHPTRPAMARRWRSGPGSRNPGFRVGIRRGTRAAASVHPTFACGLRIQSFAWEGTELAIRWYAESLYKSVVHVQARLLDERGAEIGLIEARLARGSMWRVGDRLQWTDRSLAYDEPAVGDPSSIEIRLFTEVKRPGLEGRHWIGLLDDPKTTHVTLKLR